MPPVRGRGQKGVTLIELLVGLSIIAFASSVIVLTAPPRLAPAKRAAQSLAAQLYLVTEQSILTGRRARLVAREDGYIIEQLQAGRWNVLHQWTLDPQDGVLTFALIPETSVKDNAIALKANASAVNFIDQRAGGFDRPGEEKDDLKKNADVHRIILDPLGVGAAFTVRFEGRREIWRVDLDDAGVISVTRD